MNIMDDIKIVMLLQGLMFLFLVIAFIDTKKAIRDKDIDPYERVLAQEMAKLEYEDRKIELARKKAEEEVRLKAEAEIKAKEQEEINRLDEEARNLNFD